MKIMIKTNLFQQVEGVKEFTEQVGPYTVMEYLRDPSVQNYYDAMLTYYGEKQGLRIRQVIVSLSQSSAMLQAGAMQMVLGDVNIDSNTGGVGGLLKDIAKSAVTKESAVKPRYTGTGTIVLEPTFKHILLEDVGQWSGTGGMTIEDGMFLACDATVQLETVMRKSLSGAVLGNEGLFNTNLVGSGIVALESPVPKSEIIIVDLENDVLKIDGSMAIAWSKNLNFTVEKTTRSLVGSALSGEGLVNVYRGTGRVMIANVRNTAQAVGPEGGNQGGSGVNGGAKASKAISGIANVLGSIS